MVGMNRSVRANGKGFFEFLRIEQKDGKLAYLAMPAGSVLMFLRTCQLVWRLVRDRQAGTKFGMDLQD